MQSSPTSEFKANKLPCLSPDIFITTGDDIWLLELNVGVTAGVGKDVGSHCPGHM